MCVYVCVCVCVCVCEFFHRPFLSVYFQQTRMEQVSWVTYMAAYVWLLHLPCSTPLSSSPPPTLRLIHSSPAFPIRCLQLLQQPSPEVSKETQSKILSPTITLTFPVLTTPHSDVILVSDNGQHFHAHRLVLCVQSPVFKTLLDSELWGDALKKEVATT